MSDTEQPPEGFNLDAEKSREHEASSVGIVARDVEFEPSDDDVDHLQELGLLGDGSSPDDEEVDDDSIDPPDGV